MGNEVTSAELELIRSDIEGLTLPDTCSLLTLTQTADGQGGFTDAWGTATASVACRMDRPSGRFLSEEEQFAAGIRPFSRYILTVAHDTTLTEQYRVEHGGNTYNVISVTDDASWMGARRAILERV